MSNSSADLLIEARWIVPMTRPEAVLENHSIAVRNGRIADLLPQREARTRYAGTPSVQRPDHVLLPGLVNAGAAVVSDADMIEHAVARSDAGIISDAARLSIAEMLLAGITCFADAGWFPNETAGTAAEQGIRVCVGLPVSDFTTPWARDCAEHLSKALSLRDEYKGHPAIGTTFAPRASHTLADDTLIRVRTLADELDCGISMPLHENPRELRESLGRFGLRPLRRLESLGLLTPALNARHMVYVEDAEIEHARRDGLSVTLCPRADLRADATPPVAAWTASGVALSLGSGVLAGIAGHDLWPEARLAALLSRPPEERPAALPPWHALAIATCGGAAALGLGDHVGTLESGKWADICCVDLDHPALPSSAARRPVDDLAARLLQRGGRDRVCDVWVAGRHLVSESRLTRLDWREVSERIRAWRHRLQC